MLSDATLDAIKESVKPAEIEIDGKKYASHQVYLPPEKPDQPMPEVLTLHTLTGLVDYINSGDVKTEVKIHVVNHQEVRIVGEIEGNNRKRPVYAKAIVLGGSKFHFDHYLSAEDFVIGLQSGFLDSDTRKALLAMVGNLRDESIKTAEDDGITQIATVKKGVSMAQPAIVPNPVSLAPFRTFSEVAQPESPYIFRLRRKEGELPQAALFETADRSWELKAIKLIRQFLADALADVQPAITIIA